MPKDNIAFIDSESCTSSIFLCMFVDKTCHAIVRRRMCDVHINLMCCVTEKVSVFKIMFHIIKRVLWNKFYTCAQTLLTS